MDFIQEGKRFLGKASFTVLTVMFLMDWFGLNVIDVTGLILLIGFVGKKMKESGYDWTEFDWNQRYPFEVELIGYGCILFLIYVHLFMIFLRWQPIFTLLITGLIGGAIKTHLNSWEAAKAKLSFLKNSYFKELLAILKLYIKKP
ncbi:hypothetical protein CDAR_225491 [Caerostris darwini]|uniref:Uncharacterized protein n=1 Tax=Caerostris darwini TaxID=1538125 RepID=A0AAV4R274_9ARAC|nr:hypothetical protein CDAR_225491 [Caerostris darwini]